MKLGIIGAMHEEVVGLISILENKKEIKKAGLSIYEGKLFNKDLVVVQCGIAKVNAAMCTQILISEFGVDAIVNTGVAGAINSQLDIYDIVISSDAIQYDVDTSAMGDPVGEIPRMETSVFTASDKLVKLAQDSFGKLKEESKVYVGRVATGDKFISSKEMKDYLNNQFNAYCCEMEGGAIAHVSYLNNIPFVIIRAISDKADSHANVSYEEFVVKAAEISKNMVIEMIKSL